MATLALKASECFRLVFSDIFCSVLASFWTFYRSRSSNFTGCSIFQRHLCKLMGQLLTCPIDEQPSDSDAAVRLTQTLVFTMVE
jgi:hypothetical protein